MTHRNRSRRSPERVRPITGSRRSQAPLIVELANSAPADVVAAVEAAIRAAAPLATVELVRVPAMTLPRDEPIRIRGAAIVWDAPASAVRRHERTTEAFVAALDAALAVAGEGGRLS